MKERFDLSVNTNDLFVGIYKEFSKNEEGRNIETLKIGLFKKDMVYEIKGRNRPVQSYRDIFSGNTAGLLLYEDGEDIIGVDSFNDCELLPSDYSINYYDGIMDDIVEKYGVKPFSSKIVGAGLVKLHDFEPSLEENALVSDLISTLARFNGITCNLDKEISNNRNQKTILKSIINAPETAFDNSMASNKYDIEIIPKNINTIKYTKKYNFL